MAGAGAEIVTPDERREVVDAFNAFYMEQAAKELARPERYKELGFKTLREGVKLATGQTEINPAQAIPPTYDGDGSFDTKFPGDDGKERVWREHIAYDDLPSKYSRKPHHEVIARNSRSFQDSHSWEEFTARVNLEALYVANNRRAQGGYESPDFNKHNFRSAEWDLRRRREVVFPVVGASKQGIRLIK